LAEYTVRASCTRSVCRLQYEYPNLNSNTSTHRSPKMTKTSVYDLSAQHLLNVTRPLRIRDWEFPIIHSPVKFTVRIPEILKISHFILFWMFIVQG